MSKFCTSCGATLDDEKKFCTECGASANEAPAGAAPTPPPPPPPQAPPQPQAAPVYAQAATATMPPPQSTYQHATAYSGDMAPGKGSKYEQITTKGFIGIMLLMCIPILGQILMIIWALGGCRKINKRNLARASLIMLVVALVISFVLGLVLKSLFGKVVDQIETETGISITEMTGSEKGESGGLSGLLGIIGNLSGEGSGSNNSDIQELEELNKLLEGLGGVTGEENGLEGLIDEVGKVNQEAEKHSDGWPSDLPDFPGGTMKPTADYRTEFTGTTLEDTKAYIETLKANGYKYQDFYDMGMSEEDMLEYGGWWGYNGKWYISISHSDDTTTIDHVTELPDMSNILG